MRVFAPAKINLSLHVSAPIISGAYKNYHLLDSLVVFADIGDYLEIIPSSGLGLEIIGTFANELKPFAISSNLIMRAAQELQNHCNIKNGANIILQKELPIASGIGGGSADCAAALLGLNKFWDLGLEIADLVKIGAKIGADIPICLYGKSAIMRDIGTSILAAPNLPKNIPAIIANPLIECPTPLIYKKFDELGIFDENINFDYFAESNLIKILEKTNNSLEDAAKRNFQEIALLIASIKSLDGVEIVRMSGSGASVFAIFKDEKFAKLAAKNLQEKYKNNNQKLWVCDCKLNFEDKSE